MSLLIAYICSFNVVTTLSLTTSVYTNVESDFRIKVEKSRNDLILYVLQSSFEGQLLPNIKIGSTNVKKEQEEEACFGLATIEELSRYYLRNIL